jgi:hypothetical protein
MDTGVLDHSPNHGSASAKNLHIAFYGTTVFSWFNKFSLGMRLGPASIRPKLELDKSFSASTALAFSVFSDEDDAVVVVWIVEQRRHSPKSSDSPTRLFQYFTPQ